MFAIAALLLVLAISLLITRVATVILTASGMSRERAELLRELDHRPAGPDGDLAHRAAVARQERLERTQHDSDLARRAVA